MPPDRTNANYYASGFKIEISGSELDPEAAHSILSLRVEQELNKTNSFNIEVQDEFRAGRFRWLETDLFRVGNSVSVAMGYTGTLVTMLEGKIKNINASFHTGCAPTFTIEGTDSAYDALTTPSETAVFREKRDSDIVKKIAEEQAHLSAEVDETHPVAAVKTKQGGKSYLEFLLRLAEENHFDFYLAGRKLHFRAHRHRDSVATLSWGKDLIRFEPQLNTSGAITEVIVRGWDSTGKKPIEGRATAGDEDSHESQKRTSSEMARELFGDVVKVITDRPVRTVDEANRIARSELNQAGNNLVQATAETIGFPDLTAGAWLDIAGFGRIFSGKYHIVKATHSISTNGYRTSLSLGKNTV